MSSSFSRSLLRPLDVDLLRVLGSLKLTSGIKTDDLDGMRFGEKVVVCRSMYGGLVSEVFIGMWRLGGTFHLDVGQQQYKYEEEHA